MTRLLLPILIIAGAGAVFLFFIQPTYQSIEVLRGEASRLDQALTRAAELQEARERLRTKFNERFSPEDKENLRRLLPDHIDNIRLIIDIDNIAAQYGLQIRNFGISDEDEQEPDTATAESSATAGAQGSGAAPYSSVTMNFSVDATYDDFLTFLGDLERSLRLVDVEAIGLGAGSGEDAYTYQVSIRTYWLP